MHAGVGGKTLSLAKGELDFYVHIDSLPGPLQCCLACLGDLGPAVHSQLPVPAYEVLLLRYCESCGSQTNARKQIIMPSYKGCIDLLLHNC